MREKKFWKGKSSFREKEIFGFKGKSSFRDLDRAIKR
jgi:hypothetical protein